MNRLFLTKTLRLAVCLLPLYAWGFQAETPIDPMSIAFMKQGSPSAQSVEQHQLYRAYYLESRGLEQSCTHLGTGHYSSPLQEKAARRAVAASLQLTALELLTQALGAYGEIFMSSEEYNSMVGNLVASSCSPNLSVMGLKKLTDDLKKSYGSKTLTIPTLPEWPFAPPGLKSKTNSMKAKEQEFHLSLKLFQAFCSWGGDTENYRMLTPFLANPLVMSHVLRKMQGQVLSWNGQTVETKPSGKSSQVACQDFLCRRVSPDNFKKQFPLVIGTTGLKGDLERMWCGHFRDLSPYSGSNQQPLVRKWIKAQDPEDEKLEISQLVALLTGVPDILIATQNYAELKDDLKSSINEHWGQWAKQSLSSFSRNLFFEETLEIKVIPQRDPYTLKQDLFGVDLNVGLGELDRVLSHDKLKFTSKVRLSRNWLRWVRTQWGVVKQKADPELREEFMDQVASQLKTQIQAQQKFFPTPLFGEGLEQVVAMELIEQLTVYEGPFFDTMVDTMLAVPLRFHYGAFALTYLRSKALVKTARNP